MVLEGLARFFELSRMRARSLLRAAVFYFAFVAGVTAMKSATNALFLVRRDPTDLPYLYLSTALAITLVTVFVGRSLSRHGAKPILRVSLVSSAAVLFVLGVLAALDFRPALGVLYVAGEVYATAISVLFWARLGEVFDVRTAKRVFGSIAAAGMGGAVLGGLSVRLLMGRVPAVVWCFFAVATLLGALPLLGRDRGRTALPQGKLSFRTGMAYAATERFPRGIALLVLLLSVQTAAVDYVFRTAAVSYESADEAALAGLFGVLNAVVGVLAIVVQAFGTAPMLRRFGVFVFLSLLPVASLFVAGWAAAMPALFWPVFLLKTLEMMGSLSLNQPGIQLLYNPMPPHVRDSVRALVDGAVKKLGGAAGGVLLIFFGSLFDQRQMLGMVVAGGLIILLWIRALRGHYLLALEAKLGAHRGVLAPAIDSSDRATQETLLRTLSDPDPGKVQAALSVLAHDGRVDLRPHLAGLIAHQDEGVRRRAIELVERAPDPAYGPLLVQIIERDEEVPKAHAARALEVVDPARARAVFEPIVAAPPGQHDLELVCAAIAALSQGPGEGTSAAAQASLERLLERGRAAEAEERREVARLLGLLGSGPHARQLVHYLDDPDPGVRAAAIKSAGQAHDKELPPRLLPRLFDRTAQVAVREALATYGDEVVPLLAATLDDRRIPIYVRVQLPRTLRRIGTERAAHAMLYSNVHDDAFLRYVIIEELSRMRRQHPALSFERQRTHQAVERRFRAYQHYRPISKEVSQGAEAEPVFSLLRRAVSDRVRQNLEAALRLLGLTHDMAAMEHAYRGLVSGEGGTRADALELVDVALQGSELRGNVLDFLEVGSLSVPPAGRPIARSPGEARAKAIERAYALVEGRDIQLAAIAYETLMRLGESPPEVHEPSSGEPLMPKSIIDRVFLLEGVQLFHGLAVDDLAAVAALTTEGHADPQQVVYREGDPGDTLYIIVSGEVRLLRAGQTLMDLAAGDSFGQTSILDQGPRPVTARAGDEGVEYLALERAPFMDLIADRPALMNGLFIVLARRLRELVELTGHEERREAPRKDAAPRHEGEKSRPTPPA